MRRPGTALRREPNVRYLRPSQAILQSRQRMYASFRYLANSGSRRDSPANCRTLFAIGCNGKKNRVGTHQQSPRDGSGSPLLMQPLAPNREIWQALKMKIVLVF